MPLLVTAARFANVLQRNFSIAKKKKNTQSAPLKGWIFSRTWYLEFVLVATSKSLPKNNLTQKWQGQTTLSKSLKRCFLSPSKVMSFLLLISITSKSKALLERGYRYINRYATLQRLPFVSNLINATVVFCMVMCVLLVCWLMLVCGSHYHNSTKKKPSQLKQPARQFSESCGNMVSWWTKLSQLRTRLARIGVHCLRTRFLGEIPQRLLVLYSKFCPWFSQLMQDQEMPLHRSSMTNGSKFGNIISTRLGIWYATKPAL